MSKLNPPNKVAPIFTHNGARATPIGAEAQLRRSVMSCLLFENEFYEDGETIADRITDYATKVRPEVLAQIAVETRTVANLRHVPLLLLNVLTKTGSGSSLVKDTIAQVITRSDELTDFLALYWRNGKRPLSAQMKKGLALALSRFDEYQLAKYNRDGSVKLRDVLRLVHPNPHKDVSISIPSKLTSEARADLYGRLLKDELKTPDTWEVALSGGADKKETFTRLLQEGKLGYLALLRNLRNMDQSGVDRALVESALLARKGAGRVLPFRYVAAVRAAPSWASVLDQAFKAALAEMTPLQGTTVVMVDVSGSMDTQLSQKSDMTRIDAALALGAISPGSKRLFTFSQQLVEIASYGGMADLENMRRSQYHGGTALIESVNAVVRQIPYDRLIVISDEQANIDTNRLHQPTDDRPHYMINVASARNGVGYGKWVHIDGFSENVFRFIREYEASPALAE